MKLRFVPTKAHGVLDYLSVAALLTMPRVLHPSPPVRRVLTGMAAGTLVYSLTTRYELGVVKVLPMTAHLAVDGLSGAFIGAVPLLFPDEPSRVKTMLVGYGLFALAASLTTKTAPDDRGLAARAANPSDEVRAA